jgi:diguanylate cyclase (GGDEF)-like protein
MTSNARPGRSSTTRLEAGRRDSRNGRPVARTRLRPERPAVDTLVRNSEPCASCFKIGASGSDAAKETLAVLYLDLDGFKTVNDTLGHTGGDHVLQQSAFQLKRSLRASDSIARIGGDEFAVVLRSPGNRETLSMIGEKVLDALGTVHPPEHPELRVGASIGVCIALQGRSVASAVQYADILMYEAKRAGKGQVMVGNLAQDVEVPPASIGDAV